jgi:hypothetical protein
VSEPTKVCKLCGVAKPLAAFFRNCKAPDGRLTRCADCIKAQKKDQYHTDPRKRALAIWHALLQRIRNANGKNPTYADTELRMTKDEFLAWAVPEYTRWLTEHPDKRPSVDRVRSDGHYELGNLRLLEWGENARQSRKNHNVHAPEGAAWCSRCKQYLQRTAFHKASHQPHGLSHTCATCTAQRRLENIAKRQDR